MSIRKKRMSMKEPAVPYTAGSSEYEKEQTACFTGHRFISKQDKPLLEQKLMQAVLQAYEEGIRCFLSGGAMGFDLMAARAVLKVKEMHQLPLCLEIVAPCATQSQKWTEADRREYDRICAAADKITVLSDFYYDGCMLTRNRVMVDRSALCICYLKYMRGGTLFTAGYAGRSGLKLVNLALELI